jgi:hypothetical protein
MVPKKKPAKSAPTHVLTLYGQTRDEVVKVQNAIVDKLGYVFENKFDWPYENVRSELREPNHLKEPMSSLTLRFNNRGEDGVNYATAQILANEIEKLLEEKGVKFSSRKDPNRFDPKHFARQIILDR